MYDYREKALMDDKWQREYHNLRSAGQMDDALDFLYTVTPLDEDDFYFIGQYFFEFEDYFPSIDMLTCCIDLGYKNNSTWYRSMAYLLRAYGFAKMGKYNEAVKDIDYIDDDIRVPWLFHPEKEISKAVIISLLK